ncbi:MAG TPA: tetratricopeptide repeat protein, partial [Chitinophagales bacterium]|nr:tetratricopeptide repeat protein [Chitinophagales bacterium]
SLAMTKDFIEPTSIKILDYLNEALQTIQGIEGQDVRRANCRMGIGNYYNNIGDTDTALAHFKQAAETFEQNYRLASMGNCYSNMGSCYLKMNDLANGEKYLEKALDLRMKFGSPDELCISYFNMAVLNRQKEDFLLCEEYLYKALKIAEETGNKRMVARINDKLNELTQAKRQLKAA